MSIIPERMFNVDALATAIRVLAPAQAQGIEELYVLLDDAQKKGFALGAEAARDRANDYWNTQIEQISDNAWEDGYLDGVEEARRDPSGADCIIQDILADRGLSAADDEEALEEAWKAYDRQVFRD